MRKRRSASPADSLRTRRTSGKHSRTGCFTCKIRRVKCDEEKPTCQRCRNFKVKCDGYPTQPKSCYDRSLSEVPALLPKTTSEPQILYEPSAFSFEDDTERQYFNFFCDKTSFEMAPYFPSSSRQIILQACDNPAIRHGVIAIAALHRASISADPQMTSCHLPIFPEAVDDPSLHHSIAIDQYSKSLKHMRDATSTGHQDLRTTLITCMVIVCFEGYHGNYALADNQLQIGISLIHDWKARHAIYNNNVSVFSSPAPDVIEDELIQEFGRLEIQRISFSDRRALWTPDVLSEEDTAVIQSMPSSFLSTDEARLYLNLVIKRAQNFVHVSGAFIAEGEPQHSASDEGLERTMPSTSLGLLTTFYVIPANTSDYFEGILSFEPASMEKQAFHLAELLRWKSSFESMMKPKNPHDVTPGDLVLGLHFKSCYIILLAAVAPKSSELYDDLTEEMGNIVKDSERVLDLTTQNPTACKYTLDLGVIFPLYLVGLKCRVSSIRTKAIQLLLSSPRREGIWDNTFVGKKVQWIQEIKEECLDEDGNVPLWARVNAVSMKMDLQSRKAEMICFQQTSEDLEKRERRMTMSW